jgi:hypothetical protein
MDRTLRLAYRIASLKPILPTPALEFVGADGHANLMKLVDYEASLIQKVPLFCFDNVAEFQASHPRLEWDAREDIPNWAPPLGHFFAEWNVPEVWNKGGTIVREANSSQFGFLVVAARVTEGNRGQLDQWASFLARLTGFEKSPQLEEVLSSLLAESGWVLCCSPWWALGKHPLCGAPLWLGLRTLVFVSPAGRFVENYWSGASLRILEDDTYVNQFTSALHVLGLGLSFCHCKNVVQAERPEDRGERWHRRTGIPRLTFRTLDIRPMREVLRTEGRSEEVGIARALHIVRGHFTHYTEERPLFGRPGLHGDFWMPQHVRGTAERGAVVKDYRVEV